MDRRLRSRYIWSASSLPSSVFLVSVGLETFPWCVSTSIASRTANCSPLVLDLFNPDFKKERAIVCTNRLNSPVREEDFRQVLPWFCSSAYSSKIDARSDFERSERSEQRTATERWILLDIRDKDMEHEYKHAPQTLSIPVCNPLLSIYVESIEFHQMM